MTDSTERNDTSYSAQSDEYTTDRPTFNPDATPPSTATKGSDSRALRDGVKYYHSPGSSRSEVSVQIDTEIINRKARAVELNSRLEDKD